jgi:hypothetical protein
MYHYGVTDSIHCVMALWSTLCYGIMVYMFVMDVPTSKLDLRTEAKPRRALMK